LNLWSAYQPASFRPYSGDWILVPMGGEHRSLDPVGCRIIRWYCTAADSRTEVEPSLVHKSANDGLCEFGGRGAAANIFRERLPLAIHAF